MLRLVCRDATDRGAAVRAGAPARWTPGALQLEAAGATVAMNVVTDTAAASGDRRRQGFLHGSGQSRTAFTADAAGGAQGDMPARKRLSAA